MTGLFLWIALPRPAIAGDPAAPPARGTFWQGPKVEVPAPRVDATTTADKTWSLAALTDLGLRNNPRTAAAWAAAMAQAAAAGGAAAPYWPQLDVLGGAARTRERSRADTADDLTRSYGPTVTLTYLLLDFGTRAGRLEAARYQQLAANLQHNRVLQDVVLQVEQAYYRILGVQALAEANRQSVKNAEASLDAANQRRQAGLATLGDVYQAETALAQTRLALARTEGQVTSAQGQLASAVGLPIDYPLSLQSWAPASPQGTMSKVEEWLTQAKTTRPDLAAAEARARAAAAAVKQARGQGLPTLELQAEAERSYVSDESTSDRYTTMLNLRIPLFTGFRDRFALKEARGRSEEAQAQRDQLYRQVELEVWQAYYDLQTAANSLTSATALLRSASRSYEVANARYKAGVGTILDVLTAQAAEADARVQSIQAQLDWYATLARLHHSVGALPGTPGPSAGSSPPSATIPAP